MYLQVRLVGIVPILGKGIYTGKVDKLGSVKAIIS